MWVYSKKVFERIKEHSFKLCPEKCEFFMSQIKYLGQIIDVNERRPDPSRTEAIKSMPMPKNVTTPQASLGLTNFYGKVEMVCGMPESFWQNKICSCVQLSINTIWL